MYKFSKSHQKQLQLFFYESEILIKLDYSQMVYNWTWNLLISNTFLKSILWI